MQGDLRLCIHFYQRIPTVNLNGNNFSHKVRLCYSLLIFYLEVIAIRQLFMALHDFR